MGFYKRWSLFSNFEYIQRIFFPCLSLCLPSLYCQFQVPSCFPLHLQRERWWSPCKSVLPSQLKKIFLLIVIRWHIISPQLFIIWEIVAVCKKCVFYPGKHPKIQQKHIFYTFNDISHIFYTYPKTTITSPLYSPEYISSNHFHKPRGWLTSGCLGDQELPNSIEIVQYTITEELRGLATKKSQFIALFLLQVIGWHIISPQLCILWETVAVCKKCGFVCWKTH